MFTERLEPERLTRAELDDYLARGWYRIGRALITTEYLVSGGQLRSTVWTRLDLKAHRFRPSLRKQMARVARRFRVEVGEHIIDEEHEQLYARYREHVGGERARTLHAVLGGDEGRALFETREIRLFDGGRLVAFSWFDLGEDSLQSLIGVYDPDYRRFGLGFHTMLLEIAHGAELGMRYHYSGYVLCDHPSMDYKLRVGELEYLDPKTGLWVSESPYSAGNSPAEILRRRLGAAARALTRTGTPYLVALNSALEIPGLKEQIPGCTTVPILVMCPAEDRTGVLVTWEEEPGHYALLRGVPLTVTIEDGPGDEPLRVHAFLVHDRMAERGSAEEAAHLVALGAAGLVE
ncbi:MAG: GNAT family N-acetyltransferase [Polyangiaceae bacterium]